jgi:hypothetical protein
MSEPLELQFINGDGELTLPKYKEVRWREDSAFNIDITLEEIRKRPATIQNEAQAEIFKNKMNLVRELEGRIKRAWDKSKEPLALIAALTKSAAKAPLDDLAKESTQIKNELGRWENLRRVGKARERQRAEKEIEAEQHKLATAKTAKEKTAAKQRIEKLKVEGGIVSHEAEASHGTALVKKWHGKMISPVLYWKSKCADDGYFENVANQTLINAFCKEIIRNGGKITSSTMPGVELTEETYTQWRA